jgi:D-proline reductase (dithiol) PrdB
VSLIAHCLEARGIPTLVVGTVRDVMEAVPAPRAVFVDFPAGRTFGRPGDARQHEQVLAATLTQLPDFTAPGQIRDLPAQWAADGDRAWEALVRDELLSFHG